LTDNPERDRAASEKLRRLMDEIYSEFRRIGLKSDRPAEPRRDWGPN
jgi:hypothetical protein